MMYSEFVQGTGCRETDHNYQVFKELEIIYMNTDCSKEHIYEMGKKLVDNSKTPEELEIENGWKAEIEELKKELNQYRAEVKRCQEYYDADRSDKFWRNQRDFSKDCARRCRAKIKELKWLLEV